MKRDLFRSEVLAQRQSQWLGAIVLMRPLSFTAMTVGAAAAASALIAFLWFGEYTKKVRVSGQLVPASGVLKLHVREPAVVRERRVQEGDRVRAGDVLFVFESERVSADGADLQIALREGFVRRGEQTRRQAHAQAAGLEHERAALAARIASVRAQHAQVQEEAALQQARLRLARQALDRQRGLAVQGLVAAAHVEAEESTVAAEQARALAVARAGEALQAEIASLTQLLAQTVQRRIELSAATERALAELAQLEGEFSVRGAFALRAPRDGIVTAIQAHVGQMAHPAQPLATLLPLEDELLAHLLAPSRAVGFIEPGRPVLLRYQAFPYQKFGQYEGRVESVSRTALSPPELASLGLAAAADPLYRMTVRPNTQHVTVYGEPQPLQSGMQVEADVLLERRRLMEWLFEPLLALKRRL